MGEDQEGESEICSGYTGQSKKRPSHLAAIVAPLVASCKAMLLAPIPGDVGERPSAIEALSVPHAWSTILFNSLARL